MPTSQGCFLHEVRVLEIIPFLLFHMRAFSRKPPQNPCGTPVLEGQEKESKIEDSDRDRRRGHPALQPRWDLVSGEGGRSLSEPARSWWQSPKVYSILSHLPASSHWPHEVRVGTESVIPPLRAVATEARWELCRGHTEILGGTEPVSPDSATPSASFLETFRLQMVPGLSEMLA